MAQQSKTFQPVLTSYEKIMISSMYENAVDMRWSPDENPNYAPKGTGVTPVVKLPGITIFLNSNHLSERRDEEELWVVNLESDDHRDAQSKDMHLANLFSILAVLDHFGMEYNYTSNRLIDELWYYREVIGRIAYPSYINDGFEDDHHVTFRGEEMTRNEFVGKFHTFLVRLPNTHNHNLYRRNTLY